MEMSNYRDNT